MSVLRLPIFPLPLVLFPGAPQLLHIFEPRYRRMLEDCLAGDRKFGISWAEAPAGQDPEPAPGSVGCIAAIHANTLLPDGRSNILAFGEERYTLLAYDETDLPYRVGRVETFIDDRENLGESAELAIRVGSMFRRVAAALAALNDSAGEPPEVSDDPVALSFQVAAALEIEARIKNEVLAMRSPRRRLRVLDRLLRALAESLGPRAEVHVRARRNGKGGDHASIVKDP